MNHGPVLRQTLIHPLIALSSLDTILQRPSNETKRYLAGFGPGARLDNQFFFFSCSAPVMFAMVGNKRLRRRNAWVVLWPVWNLAVHFLGWDILLFLHVSHARRPGNRKDGGGEGEYQDAKHFTHINTRAIWERGRRHYLLACSSERRNGSDRLIDMLGRSINT